MNFIRMYKELPYERRVALNTFAGLCLSVALALGKLVVGLFTDYNLIGVALYTLGILLAKAECVLGIKNDKKTFARRNALTAAFLLLSSAAYVGFMCRLFFCEREAKNYGMAYVLILAFISFCELGFAIAGLFRARDKGHYCRNIKIANLCVALIAILTTQIAILDMEAAEADIYNAWTGIGVGCYIALCAAYILAAPRMSVTGREHNKFVLADADKNGLMDMSGKTAEITLCRSRVYGDYIFRAKAENGAVEGDIVRGRSLWKRMCLPLKILCCILSEILIFAWIFGRVALFFRAADLPSRLGRLMAANGFERAD